MKKGDTLADHAKPIADVLKHVIGLKEELEGLKMNGGAGAVKKDEKRIVEVDEDGDANGGEDKNGT